MLLLYKIMGIIIKSCNCFNELNNEDILNTLENIENKISKHKNDI